MIPFRSLRVKTILLATPLLMILLYFSFQRRQFVEWPSFVPSPYLAHSSNHVPEQTHKPAPLDKTQPQQPVHSISLPIPKSQPTPDVSPPQKPQVNTLSVAKPTQNTTQVDASAVEHNTLHDPYPKKNSSIKSNSTGFEQNTSHANNSSFRKKQIEFWRSLEPLIVASSPDCQSPNRLGVAGMQAFVPSKELIRPKFLEMSAKSVEEMRNAHGKFVNSLKGSHPKMVFTPSSRGIVSTAGGAYLPVFVISLRMLRRTGTTLPVEVFMADHDEYEEYICEEVLPTLNATCVVLSDILKNAPHAMKVTRYQLKVFAMMFSSFEDILFLDADSFPVQNPEQLFTSQLFQEQGLITWPDFWASSISTYFYDITDQSVPPMNQRASTETGELLLSKKTHQRSLLLAAYYNCYGPTHYYPLLSQGSPGEGDKETFLAAASVLNESFYATSEPVQPMGHVKDVGGIDASAMVQYDPIQDYTLTEKGLWRIKDPSVAKPPRPFFVHAHFPKFNPATIFDEGGPTKYANGKDRLAWTDEEKTIKSFGVDLEKQFWEEIKRIACEFEGQFKTWRDRNDICKNAKMYWKNIYGTPPMPRKRERRTIPTFSI